MNQRIVKLFMQSVDSNYIPLPIEDHIPSWTEKFAELIVKECINKVRSRQMFSIEDEHNIHHAFDLLVYDLESYFGVEE